jgi:hypothetical protein
MSDVRIDTGMRGDPWQEPGTRWLSEEYGEDREKTRQNLGFFYQ